MLPKLSMPHIFPFKGPDQAILLKDLEAGISRMDSPVLKLVMTVLKSLAEETTMVGSEMLHDTPWIPL